MLNDKIKIKLSGIIVNADDYGLSLSRNEAVIHAFTQKMCSRGSIVVNTPYFEDAVKLAKENDLMGKFGLHINLTSGVPLTLPIDGSPPGSPVPGILQAKTLEWVAISFSNA